MILPPDLVKFVKNLVTKFEKSDHSIGERVGDQTENRPQRTPGLAEDAEYPASAEGRAKRR